MTYPLSNPTPSEADQLEEPYDEDEEEDDKPAVGGAGGGEPPKKKRRRQALSCTGALVPLVDSLAAATPSHASALF